MPADSCLNISCTSLWFKRSKSEKGGLVRLKFGLAMKACHSVFYKFPMARRQFSDGIEG